MISIGANTLSGTGQRVAVTANIPRIQVCGYLCQHAFNIGFPLSLSLNPNRKDVSYARSRGPPNCHPSVPGTGFQRAEIHANTSPFTKRKVTT